MSPTGDPPSPPIAPHDLSRLGWLLFEELCSAWLQAAGGVAPQAWRGSADRQRYVLLEHPVTLSEGPEPVPPTMVATLWLRRINTLHARASETFGPVLDSLAKEVGAKRAIRSAVLVTNVAREDLPFNLAEVCDVPSSVDLHVVDSTQLSAAIEADVGLRLWLPSVLGVREGEAAWFASGAETGFDIGDALALAERFVPTRAYRRALAVLRAHHFCVLTGPPEMGKTAAARMIALALVSDGWEVHECTRPEQLLERADAGRRQVFIADDAFGSTEYRPDAAEGWARELPEILAGVDERHWLIWTSRPTPLKAGLHRVHQERGTERFPSPAQVHVDAADLDAAEKALILFRHTMAGRLPASAIAHVRAQGVEMVDHPHFTPERIRRFVQLRLPALVEERLTPVALAGLVAWEIESPTEAMAASFRALGPLHRAVLVAMLDSPPGVVSERALGAATRRQAPSGLDNATVDLVERLTDHFLRRVPPTSVTWVHPSWRDLVIEELAADPEARRGFLRACGHHGALLAISVGGGARGARTLPLLKDDGDWDALADRMPELVRSAGEREMVELLDGLRAALGADDDTAHSEVGSLVGLVLALAVRARPEREPVTVAYIEAWLRLWQLVPGVPVPPWTDATWIDLLPTRVPDIDSPAELTRYEDWLALVEVLEAVRPGELRYVGFPSDRQLEIADKLARAAARRIEEEGVGSPASERLRRLLMLAASVPGPRPLTFHVPEVLDLEAIGEGADPAASRSLAPDPMASSLVGRILSDLG